MAYWEFVGFRDAKLQFLAAAIVEDSGLMALLCMGLFFISWASEGARALGARTVLHAVGASVEFRQQNASGEKAIEARLDKREIRRRCLWAD
jgi:hypothetical protein